MDNSVFDAFYIYVYFIKLQFLLGPIWNGGKT
jgi:hypothetical protein